MKNKTIFLKSGQEFITLQAVLQLSDIIQTGGMAKEYLSTNCVKVNGEDENRRGRKLYHDDVIEASNVVITVKKDGC